MAEKSQPTVVRDIMSEDPYVVELDEPIAQVLHKLMEADVRHLPVVEEGELVGIVSDRDLKDYAPASLLELEAPEQLEQMMNQPVSGVMSGDVVSVDPEANVAEVVDLMLEHKVGAIPVVEADSARLVGIVSYVDVIRAARDLL